MSYQNDFIRKNYYSLELKHKICKDHIERGIGLCELARKYNLSTHSLIHDWLRNLGYLPGANRRLTRSAYIGIENINILPDKSTKDKQPSISIDEQKEIAYLKKELEDAKLLAEGYRRMIEIAEKELQIPIRKKYNSK